MVGCCCCCQRLAPCFIVRTSPVSLIIVVMCASSITNQAPDCCDPPLTPLCPGQAGRGAPGSRRPQGLHDQCCRVGCCGQQAPAWPASCRPRAAVTCGRTPSGPGRRLDRHHPAMPGAWLPTSLNCVSLLQYIGTFELGRGALDREVVRAGIAKMGVRHTTGSCHVLTASSQKFVAQGKPAALIVSLEGLKVIDQANSRVAMAHALNRVRTIASRCFTGNIGALRSPCARPTRQTAFSASWQRTLTARSFATCSRPASLPTRMRYILSSHINIHTLSATAACAGRQGLQDCVCTQGRGWQRG